MQDIQDLQSQINALNNTISSLKEEITLQNRILQGFLGSKINPQKELYIDKDFTIATKEIKANYGDNRQAVKVKYIAIVDTIGDSIPVEGSLRHTTGDLQIYKSGAWVQATVVPTP